MGQKAEVRISVRRLVEFILRRGDIDSGNGFQNSTEAMQEGGKAHRKLQKAGGRHYQSEVSLKVTIPIDETMDILVEGRADGIITEDDQTIIDEIKGTYGNLSDKEEADPLHMAQAACYGYIYAREHKLESIWLQVTYISLESEKIVKFKEEKNFEELSLWFENLVRQYSSWAKWKLVWEEKRNQSIEELKFPFEYRQSQKTMVSGVYQSIIQGKRLFAQAPTGTGKTLAAIFPAIKAMAASYADKIFYLTAKTIARTVARDTMILLQSKGLCGSFIILTAKEKICVMDEVKCLPRFCERACGHFDRVNEAVFDIINHECAIDSQVILAYAKKHQVCPFEMQLDVSLWVDMVICDYNYVFDPNVSLKRFFGEQQKEDYIFLIDEAHNLVERARDIYSASLSKKDFLNARKLIKPYHPKLSTKISKCYRYMNELEADGQFLEVYENAGGLILYLLRVVTDMEEFLKEEWPSEVNEAALSLYFDIRRFIAVHDELDDCYVVYGKSETSGDFILKLYCVDPSEQVSLRLSWAVSAILFSATLIPVGYYKSMLSQSADTDYDLYVESPFDSKKCLVVIGCDVSSRYSLRGVEQYTKIAAYIYELVRGKNGNYMVFFPSYLFMEEVFNVFAEKYLSLAGNGMSVYCQESHMGDQQKEQFLGYFRQNPTETTIGFCVLGGVFSEGIDLKEDRLIGTVIVGTGLPMVTEERELLKSHFDKSIGAGFNYAYLYPGMNKVQQAAGRVIRTEEDRGVVALLDERFRYRMYKELFPREWQGCRRIRIEDTQALVENFWDQMTTLSL